MNGWTGGQYSVVRALTGVLAAWWSYGYLDRVRDYAAGSLVPRMIDLPPAYLAAGLLAGFAIPASLAFAVGWKDRMAAWVVLASLLPQVWLERGPVALVAASIMVAHILTPDAPFMSLAARNRTDPGGGWILPDRAWNVLWGTLALDGVRTVAGELRYGVPAAVDSSAVIAGIYLFASLAGLNRRWRPIAWLVAVVLVCFTREGGFDDMFRAAYLPFFLLLFDPGWVPPASMDGAVIFYDGWCGLCHRAVRFILAEDPVGQVRFSPLQGNSISRKLDAATRSRLPDSLVLLTEHGSLNVKSRAVLVAGEGLGGYWRIVSAVLIHLPAEFTDALYDALAGVRSYLFPTPKETCPMLPHNLAKRFMN